MVFGRPRSLHMAHDGAGHALEKGQLVGRQSIARLLVEDAIGANAMARRTANGDAGIEARIGRALDKRIVAEALILAQVVYDERGQVTGVVEGQRRILWGKINGVVAQALLLGEDGGAKAEAVVVKLGLARVERQGFGCFGEEEAVLAVEEGNEAAAGIQAQRPQLGKGREGLIVGDAGGIVERRRRGAWGRL